MDRHPLGRAVIVGGGAAGFFAAVTCAEAAPSSEVLVFEKGAEFLTKVRISGGGRCNVTHACFEPAEFVRRYPRGARELIGPFRQFHVRETVAWFAARGVPLKTEADGRMFPLTNTSQTVVDCLLQAAANASVQLRPQHTVQSIRRAEGGGFVVAGEAVSRGLERSGRPFTAHADVVLLALGGCRTAAVGQLAVQLGHSLVPPVPSLFAFVLREPWLRALAGVSVESVEVSVPQFQLKERGPLLVTHNGLSGPAILRLSAWGARPMEQCRYQFPLRVNWLPHRSFEELRQELDQRRTETPARKLTNVPIAPLSARLWEQLVLAAGIPEETRCADLSRQARHHFTHALQNHELPVVGKSLNKDEFVTSGGVDLREVSWQTMESRRCPGLYFAGEVLDVDGVTGGFNFQAAWTTGWIAGRAMAAAFAR